MDFFAPTAEAFHLLLSGDAALWRIIFTSLACSIAALVLIAPPAIALGFLVAHVTFPGRRVLVVLMQANPFLAPRAGASGFAERRRGGKAPATVSPNGRW